MTAKAATRAPVMTKKKRRSFMSTKFANAVTAVQGTLNGPPLSHEPRVTDVSACPVVGRAWSAALMAR
jgi:hypothetical protein